MVLNIILIIFSKNNHYLSKEYFNHRSDVTISPLLQCCVKDERSLIFRGRRVDSILPAVLFFIIQFFLSCIM